MKAHQSVKRPALASRIEPKEAALGPAPPRARKVDCAVVADQDHRPVHRFANLALQRASDAAPPPNRTGLPDRLKAGIEHLSGFAMDDVRVHYNSPKPATVQALAYTKGPEIHVGPGQEKHLPHEAWHVAQQKQGRVKPTLQMKGIAINDDETLEREADDMAERAAQLVLDDLNVDSPYEDAVAHHNSALQPFSNSPAQRKKVVGGAELSWEPIVGAKLGRYAEDGEVKGEAKEMEYLGRSDNKAVWFVDTNGKYDPSMATQRPYYVTLPSGWVADEKTVWIHSEAEGFKGEAQHPDNIIVKENEKGAYGIGKNLILDLRAKCVVQKNPSYKGATTSKSKHIRKKGK